MIGAGEEIRTLDPNLGKIRLENFCSRLKMGEEDEIEIPISQEEFARMLGFSRRTMVDALAKLQNRKLIRRSYGSIHVKASGFVT